MELAKRQRTIVRSIENTYTLEFLNELRKGSETAIKAVRRSQFIHVVN